MYLCEDSCHEVVREIHDNLKKLKNCKSHNFNIDLTPKREYAKKFQCSNCLGTVGETEKRFYEQGVSHTLKKVSMSY